MPLVLPFRRLHVTSQEEDPDDDDNRRIYKNVLAGVVGGVEQYPCINRKLVAWASKLFEDAAQFRHEYEHNAKKSEHGNTPDDYRVCHRTLHLLFHAGVGLDLFGKALHDLV